MSQTSYLNLKNGWQMQHILHNVLAGLVVFFKMQIIFCKLLLFTTQRTAFLMILFPVPTPTFPIKLPALIYYKNDIVNILFGSKFILTEDKLLRQYTTYIHKHQ